MKLTVLLTIVAVCFGAPADIGSQLDHPSPVNPTVLIDLKPKEKITLISDANELSKYKRQTIAPLYPTVLPEEKFHHITKRGNNEAVSKRDIPVPLVAKHKHPDVLNKSGSDTDPKDKVEHKPPEADLKLNEDVGESKISQKTDGQNLTRKNDIVNNPSDLTNVLPHEASTTTQHPVIRPKPVPVAELFARHQDHTA
ncbi:uncharacterized protein LOC106089716 [Stomoxys calcitrans]|uniref:uncharacterized protein LOC106089716 n=1 Tax=Stomoxys calcitrans TaxID=35570 RepID=UPI0027E29560|nr:uncharacterized protein LOC106089716 [Stomoxys calcitrans]